MKVLLLLITIIINLTVQAADPSLKAPPNFKFGKSTAVFVDITRITSTITYDLGKNEARVTSILNFTQTEVGNPIFDLKPMETEVLLNREELKFIKSPLPGNVSTVKILNRQLEPGNHTLTVTNNLEKNVSFSRNGVKSAFWMSDLSDRKYLEQYFPVNLEFDQYKMNFEVQIVGTSKEHKIQTNGEVKVLAKNHFSISYPKYFTASSIFYHLMPVGSFTEKEFLFKSIDGRELPVSIYSSRSIASYVSKTKLVLAELEKDYGPFPHNKVIVYGAGSGGMEFCGATITSLSALGHELTHSYFARGIMPARGNSGWVDEAVASWRDGGYRQYSSRSLSPTQMAGHSVYRRTTDRNAYSKGARFMGFLDGKFSESGGLKVFLKKFKEDRLFKPFLTMDFKNDLELHFGEDLTQEFNKYIFGSSRSNDFSPVEENPYHPRRTEKELLELL